MLIPLFIGGIIKGIGNFLGGNAGAIIGAGSNLAGAEINAAAQERINAENRAFDREFANNAVQWRIADADKAGIHPIYALGTPLPSPTSQAIAPDRGSGIAAAGQDISRAIAAKQTEQERREAVAQARIAASERTVLFGQQVERNSLENELLRNQIARLKQQSPPGLPPGVATGRPSSSARRTSDLTASDVVAGRVEPLPSYPTIGDVDAPFRQPGIITEGQWMKTPKGYVRVPSIDAKERTEDNILLQFGWALRDFMLPQGGYQARELPPRPLGQNERWARNPITGEWRVSSRKLTRSERRQRDRDTIDKYRAMRARTTGGVQ